VKQSWQGTQGLFHLLYSLLMVCILYLHLQITLHEYGIQPTGECEAELKDHSSLVNFAVFSPDGMHIVSVCADNTAQIWNKATGRCETEWKGHLDRNRSASVLMICMLCLYLLIRQHRYDVQPLEGEAEIERPFMWNQVCCLLF